MANENKNKDLINPNCSVCNAQFSNSKECLKHELLKHSLQKNNRKTCGLRKKVNAAAKFLNSAEKKDERVVLEKRLNQCERGQELKIIFEMYCAKNEHLNLILKRIQTCLKKELASAGIMQIYPYGSTVNGLALRDCDIDIFLDIFEGHTPATHTEHKNDEYYRRKAFNRINNSLKRSYHFTNVYALRKAKVPIIKCTHKSTGFNIDISISHCSSRENSLFIYDLIKCDARIHELMLFLKIWAKNTQLIAKGNMNSYCLATMILFALQRPRKTDIHSSEDNNFRILKSIKEMQKNCSAHMVEGVNYAYDLSSGENKPQISADITTWDLIKDFFDFYHNFNFEDYIISPYYGQSLKKTDFTPNSCPEYQKQQKTITQHLEGKHTNDLEIARCMCIQDVFRLNQNNARNIWLLNKEYITLCLRNAQKICENPQKLEPAKLYEQLLFETINDGVNTSNTLERINNKIMTDLYNLKVPKKDCENINNNNEGKLDYKILPSKSDLGKVVAHYPTLITGEEILRCWCQQYVQAIATFTRKLYHIDMQKLPTQQKQQKLDADEKHNDLNQSWLIFCTVDLWSNRCFQKCINNTFMCYQLEQTERLYNLRRNDSKYSVTFNGILNLNILPNYKGINIQVEVCEGTSACSLNKKSPIRKFFSSLKNSLRNCNFKEILDIDDKTENKSSNETTDTGVTAIQTTVNPNDL